MGELQVGSIEQSEKFLAGHSGQPDDGTQSPARERLLAGGDGNGTSGWGRIAPHLHMAAFLTRNTEACLDQRLNARFRADGGQFAHVSMTSV